MLAFRTVTYCTENEETPKNGFARDREEFVAGLTAIAVPVYDEEGAVRGTISVHAPTPRMSMEQAVGRRSSLRAATSEMGKLL